MEAAKLLHVAKVKFFIFTEKLTHSNLGPTRLNIRSVPQFMC